MLRKLAFVAVSLVAGAAAQAQAPGADLTDAEWDAWPGYCKYAFVISDWGNRSRFAKKESALPSGNAAGTGLEGPHHFCIGMVYINRARTAATSAKRTEYLRGAVDEIGYTYSRSSRSAPVFPLMSAELGTAYYRLGQRRNAFEVWITCVEAQPRSRECYLTMAQAHLTEGNPKDALEVLLAYDRVKTAPSADAEYFLGHTYFELGRYAEARQHADKAYELGYPALGLKERLDAVEKKGK